VFSQRKFNLVLNLSGLLICIGVSFLAVSCVKKSEKDPSIKSEILDLPKVENVKAMDAQKKNIDELKKWAEKIRFLASIEKESLNVLNSNVAFTQIEVVSFAIDRFVGIKKPNIGIFCHQFEIKQTQTLSLEVYATCEKPIKKLAEIKITTHQGTENGEIIFFTRSWAPIIGEFPALTAPDRSCFFSVKNNSIFSISCKNTVYALPPEFIEELRIDQFEYQKSKENQLSIDGGIFRDLVKRREIKMNVPLAGAIEIVERELKVRDDFEHLLKKSGR
jgi:hypothetical protein